MTATPHLLFSCVAAWPLLTSAGQFVLVAGLAFGLLTLAASVLRFHFMTAEALPAKAEALPPQDVFQLQIVQRLGTAHRDPAPFCVILLSVHGLDETISRHGESTGEEILSFVAEIAGECVRRRDVVCRLPDRRVGLIVDADRRQAPAVADRILLAVSAATCRCSSGLTEKLMVHLGVATCPENGERAALLGESARAALAEAAQGRPNSYRLAAASTELTAPAPAPAPPDQRGLIDPLTGVLLSERLPRAMQKYVSRLRKDGHPVSVLFLGVDHLARYNDHYGAGAADMLMQGVGHLLQEVVREDDLIARWGGEEFVVLMGCAPEGGLLAAQRVAADLRKRSFEFKGTKLKITTSTGVAGCPMHGRSPRQLLEAAHAALRAARKKGRGVCLIYDEAMRTRAGITASPEAF